MYIDDSFYTIDAACLYVHIRNGGGYVAIIEKQHFIIFYMSNKLLKSWFLGLGDKAIKSRIYGERYLFVIIFSSKFKVSITNASSLDYE